MRKRTVALLCAAVMLLGVVFGGTMAWLSKGSEPLTNTFKAGDIIIELTETERTYVMAPGTRLDKDPTVTVAAGSEKCIVFVKAEADKFGEHSPITWGVRSDWTQVPGETDVWYQVCEKSDVAVKYPILTDMRADGMGQVSIPATLTKEQLADYEKSKPTLTFTAYAIQYEWLPEYDPETDEIPTDKIASVWDRIVESKIELTPGTTEEV